MFILKRAAQVTQFCSFYVLWSVLARSEQTDLVCLSQTLSSDFVTNCVIKKVLEVVHFPFYLTGTSPTFQDVCDCCSKEGDEGAAALCTVSSRMGLGILPVTWWKWYQSQYKVSQFSSKKRIWHLEVLCCWTCVCVVQRVHAQWTHENYSKIDLMCLGKTSAKEKKRSQENILLSHAGIWFLEFYRVLGWRERKQGPSTEDLEKGGFELNCSCYLAVFFLQCDEGAFSKRIVQMSCKVSPLVDYLILASSSSSSASSSRTLLPLALVDENDSKEQFASFQNILSEQNYLVATNQQVLYTVVSR